ncbi:MAG: peptidoglycan DD-metalloendopeptidase family protein [Prevotella sp.]|nr:peptidoglycan DD-metalloendopeptidase family protein [Prevotella sp.]
MKKIFFFCFILLISVGLSAQKKQPVKAQPRAAATARKQSAAKKPTAKKPAAKKAAPKKSAAKPKPVYSNSSIKGLQTEREKIQKKIREQEQQLRANRADVKKRLSNLVVLNSEITEKQKTIEGIQKDILSLSNDIDVLKKQLDTLEMELGERKTKYIKSMRYMYRQRAVPENLVFIFSAQNFSQMYRRFRFMREYANFQRAQGELVKTKQAEITQKHTQLEAARGEKNNLLSLGRKEQEALQHKQEEQQKIVSTLQSQQRAIQGVIAQQRKKDAELNAQIDRLIAEEVAKARARAAAEAKKKAEQEAAERRRREQELARKQAEAEERARENERKIAAARAAEERAKAAKAAAQSAEEKERNEKLVRDAESNRKALEKKADKDKAEFAKVVAEHKRESKEMEMLTSVDRKLTGNFENNRGRLPIPITGSYKIVSHYGQYNVEGLRNVTLDNKGINILGQAGCKARSIFEGEVSAVFRFGETMIVMVRHGKYISVYCNLRSVSVQKGQRVSARQVLGVVGDDHILQFQLRRETVKLNPEAWLGR